MKRILIVSTLAMALGAAAAAQAATPPATYTGHELAGQAKIGLEEAQAVALKARPAAVTDKELEKEQRGLSEVGHTVDATSAGRSGLMLAAGETYDVIILDRMLPEIDGLAILRTIRASGVKTPVLLLTALGGIDDRVEGLEAGGDDYLVKPFAPARLPARVHALARPPPPPGKRTGLSVAHLTLA